MVKLCSAELVIHVTFPCPQIHVHFSLLFLNHLLSETTVALELCLTCEMLTLRRKMIPENLIASQLFKRVRIIAKTTISSVMYICPQRITRFQPDGFPDQSDKFSPLENYISFPHG